MYNFFFLKKNSGDLFINRDSVAKHFLDNLGNLGNETYL